MCVTDSFSGSPVTMVPMNTKSRLTLSKIDVQHFRKEDYCSIILALGMEKIV